MKYLCCKYSQNVFKVGHDLFSFTNKKAQMINVNSLFIIHK